MLEKNIELVSTEWLELSLTTIGDLQDEEAASRSSRDKNGLVGAAITSSSLLHPRTRAALFVLGSYASDTVGRSLY